MGEGIAIIILLSISFISFLESEREYELIGIILGFGGLLLFMLIISMICEV